MTRTSRRTRLATVALIAPLALGLVACGDDDDGDDTTSSETAGDNGATVTLQGDVETAAQTALAEVDGTVFSVSGEPQGWEVTIVTTDGSEHELDLSADGSSVTRERVESAQDDPDDAAERERLLGASLDYLAAMEAAAGEVDGTVHAVELSDDDGTAVWVVTFDDDTPDETTVEIDAETGDVLRTEQGD